MLRPRPLSASRVWLAMQCLYPFRPDVTYNERPPGREAQLGSAVHRLVESHLNNVPYDPPDEFASDAKRMAMQAKRWLDGQRWDHCEIGLRYDTQRDTATEGPRRGDPGYEDVPPWVIPMTLDLLRREPDGSLSVIDLKTGRECYAHPEQLHAQAVAASRAFRASTVRVGFLFVRKTKTIESMPETLDADRLDAEAGRLYGLLRRLPTAEPQRHEACWSCPLGPAKCPAWEDGVTSWQSTSLLQETSEPMPR